MNQAIIPQRFGLRAVLLECANLDQALSAHRHLSMNPPEGVLELIPAAQTVLVRFETAEQTTHFQRTFRWKGSSRTELNAGKERVIDVIYNGEDLAEVAELTGLTTDGVIEAHTSQSWSVAFAGFAPGFFYLHGTNNSLKVPRRSSPRTAVPVGAVGLAGAFSGIYPRVSPGGWQLIGQTNAPLWDIHQDPPALLEPGNTVRFRAVKELITVSEPQPAEEKEPAKGVLTVTNAGAQLLFQDQGRAGLTHWGVSPSGYADPVAANDANYLVGNDRGETVLESLMGGFALTADEDSVLALTGAKVTALISEEGKKDRVVPQYLPFALLAGQKLTVGHAEAGLRVYCAIRGAFATEISAQSASFDTMSEIGPRPITTGTRLTVEKQVGEAVHPLLTPATLPATDQATVIRVVLGPRDHWFTADSITKFTETEWTVTSQSNRIGIRLKPETEENQTVLKRFITDELPSEGMVSGAIQVPPNGEPVVFLADHPVTGGYPVIATVHPEDLRLLAQAQPGTTILFNAVSAENTIDHEETHRA